MNLITNREPCFFKYHAQKFASLFCTYSYYRLSSTSRPNLIIQYKLSLRGAYLYVSQYNVLTWQSDLFDLIKNLVYVS